ncbi:ribulose-phosphate 3-epimerase [Boudabousia marimammalium]|uniref:Ribulose-phosphate 3-epimerase n=1 Tax=Boudabousia marimammalium TaxID=156892 RepID=A0A1Q5PR06_9ACTO|nr:ribulose-phosphate 3-epimerase [Boudabousia marimammalium]OKL49997.1 ribulose-phosphate 3-epimerase [Boudabousia marimammalium]
MSLIHPSILNSDTADLAGELTRISSADAAHVDVMDNHFVPNLTWGLPVVESLIRRNIMPIDAHLMIADPDRWAPAYAEAGCDSVTFHVEAARAPVVLAHNLHKAGARVGVGVRPGTPLSAIEELLPYMDMALIMTVEPGFGGQAFIESMLPKIRRLRALLNEQNLDIQIQVDGGVSRHTIAQAAEAGANVFVAGSAVFGAEDAAEEIAALRKIADPFCHC